MKTLILEEAAKILHMHKVVLRNKCRSGEVTAAKLGKRWLFLEVDLTNWLRLQYSPLALQGEQTTEVKQCHSTNEKIALTGGLNLKSTEDEYRKALGLTMKT
ncbi:MAG: helix-turn-helix domain-containing protein [Methyloglobulus sp.]|nr:helix-turn-helix domain-containing protein [Methyloglobulus sp.]